MQQINRGVGHFMSKFTGVPFGTDLSCWGCKEHPRLTDVEIIFEEFQFM